MAKKVAKTRVKTGPTKEELLQAEEDLFGAHEPGSPVPDFIDAGSRGSFFAGVDVLDDDEEREREKEILGIKVIQNQHEAKIQLLANKMRHFENLLNSKLR